MKSTLVIFSVLLSVSAAWAEGPSRVLLLGDSHAYGRYGTVLDAHFRKGDTQVTSLSSCGSSPSTWTTSSENFKSTNCGFWKKNSKGQETRVTSHRLPSFGEELAATKPDLTVITLGTNFLASPANIKSEKAHVEKMMKQINAAGSACIWVGPPDLKKDPFKKNLELGVKELKSWADANNCQFIDSTKLTKYPGGKTDGIHYGPKDSAAWGEAVVKEISKLKINPPAKAPAPKAAEAQKKTGNR
ncbi:SGNH/GDSL hydrolase family protein [Bdellovibrio bacteriovorus]|uniref:SGNH/GDSL hydrolase family protein n=1 Tax=Bdellovibrio bacteriovorus TaxID=959 RepID=UPI003AA843F2